MKAQPVSTHFDAAASALRTLSLESQGLKALEAALQNGLQAGFREAVDGICAVSGRVIVAGIGKSGHVARKIAATMASTGTPAYFVHPAEASHGDLGMIRSEDVILALSWSGETAELKPLIDYAKRFGVLLIGLCAEPRSTLAKAADVSLVLPKSEEACPNGLAPTTSTIMQMALGDCLAVALLEKRGFSAKDFGIFHPGGKLGSGLKLVRDLMHREDLPAVQSGTLLQDAILTMTQGRLGCALVLHKNGELAGLVTDGDLRRALEKNRLQAKVDDVMTVKPRKLGEDTLAAEALHTMYEQKITVLPVVDAGDKPIGLLHLHDLLRIGVV